jgi:hypothetical protein
VSGEPWIFVAAAPVVVALCTWAVTDLQRFVYLLIPPAMISPAAIFEPGGAIVAVSDVLTAVALSAWVVSNAVSRTPRVWLRGNPLFLPTLLYVGFTAASLAWSIDLAATLELTIQLTEIVLLTTLLFASVPNRIGVVRMGLIAFVAAAFVLSVITLVTVAPRLGSNLESIELPGGLNKNVVGSFVGAGVVVMYIGILSHGPTAPRVAAVLIFAIMALALMATFSRGSILGAIAAIVTMSCVLRRIRLGTALVAGSLLIVYLATVGVESRINQENRGAGSYDSGEVRVITFRDARERIADDPVVGTGAGTYEIYIDQFDLYLVDPNNMLLLTWIELGFFGLAALLLVLGSYARWFARCRELPPEYALPAVAAGGISLSLLVHFQVDVTWTRGTASLAFAMIGAMLACHRLAHAPAPAPPTQGRESPKADPRVAPEATTFA